MGANYSIISPIFYNVVAPQELKNCFYCDEEDSYFIEVYKHCPKLTEQYTKLTEHHT